jgi:hypothetical protein
MSFFLFVSSDADFNKRILSESGSKVLIAESLLQGAELVSNPNSCFNAIFLDPNDSSFSALQFLDLCLSTRPGTPVFLIENASEISSASFEGLCSHPHWKGVFDRESSYSTILSKAIPTKKFIIPQNLKRPTDLQAREGYIAVPAIDFAQAGHFIFDAYCENEEGKLTIFAKAGSEPPLEILDYVAHGSHFYISEKSISQIRDEVRAIRSSLSDLNQFPVSWKTAETLFKAKALLRELQSKSLSDEAVNSSYEIFEDVFKVIGQLQTTKNFDKIQQFIDQAMDCDRNIACSILCILMCKTLKFEKKDIEEILGISSIFQDIALYNSPFGDLSKIPFEQMNHQQKEFFKNHPMISADLLAENTSVPSVTLQVIQQHHERRDRTGFPRKIGGIQFHPMAEILSLINEVIERNPQSLEAENEIYRHYSDRIVQAYKAIQFRRNDKKSAA